MEITTRYYAIGELTLAIRGPEFHESAYLSPFRCEPAPAQILFRVAAGHPVIPRNAEMLKETLHTADCLSAGHELTVFYREGSRIPLLTREQTAENHYEICLETDCLSLYDTNLVLKILDLPQLLLKNGGIFLHASLIEVRKSGILFTAEKQVGKSTQAALWKKYRGAEIINGDRGLLRRMDGKWMVCGSPYCGTSGICQNAVMPLRAVVILQQGPRNVIHAASARETVAAFLSGCTFDPETQSEIILDAALELWKAVPVYVLSCLPEESAVACLEQALGI